MNSGNSTLLKRLWKDCDGAHLVEFTLVLPVLLLVALGTVDVGLLLFDWNSANKAAYRGAREAIVWDPVASEVVSLPPWDDETVIGHRCFVLATGALDGAKCPAINTVCTAGSCSGGETFDNVAFTHIFDKMRDTFPRLTPANVSISYETNNLGFVGRQHGLPMNVTVSIRCMTAESYFLGALMAWVFTPPAGCGGVAMAPGWPLPAFATTLPSEDLDRLDDPT